MSLATIQSYKLKSSLNESTSSHFEIERVRLESSCSTNKSHRSDHYKIFFVENGSGNYQIDFNEFTIDNAGIFCLSPGQVLTVKAELISSAYQIIFNQDFYCVEAHGKEIACNGVLFNNVHRATFIPLGEQDKAVFREYLEKMIEELSQPGSAHKAMLESYLKLFMIEALRRQRVDLSVASGNGNGENRLVGDYIALVDKHFREIHSVSDYAERLFVSPKSLAKRLNALGHKTPKEILRDRIVLEAQRDLRYSDKSVKEIAFDLGFDDPAYFTRYFKKATGQSPLNYKSNL